MALKEVVMFKLTGLITKWVAGKVLPDGLAGAGEDIANELIKSGMDAAEARARGTRAQQAAKAITGVVESRVEEFGGEDVNAEAVTDALARAFDAAFKSSVLFEHDLDAGRLREAIRGPGSPVGFSERETAMYEASLAALAEAMVAQAPALPGYTSVRDGELLKRTGRTEQVTHEALTEIKNVRKAVVDGPAKEADAFRERYAMAVVEQLDEMDLFGVDLPKESKQYGLTAAYISLSLESGPDGAQGGALSAGLLLGQATSRRLLIEGEAGCGKSTLMKWMAINCTCAVFERNGAEARGMLVDREACDHWYERTGHGVAGCQMQYSRITPEFERVTFQARFGREDTPTPWAWRTPFLVRLKDCKNGKLPAIESFVDSTAIIHREKPKKWVEGVLRNGLGLVMLDGIDEVPPKHRDALHTQIRALVNEYPESMFVLTTRPLTEGAPPWIEELGFTRASVSPMSAADREACIDKWHDAVAAELDLLGRGGADLGPTREKLKAALRDAPEIARLATNPLLCAMICALHRSRSRLPESLAELLSALCEMLLYRRERETPGFSHEEFDPAYVGLTYEQRRNIVSHLAKYMIVEGESALPRAMVVRKVGEALESIRDRSKSDAEAVVRGLVERSGMLREKTPDMIDFIHNTFKEYLAARLFLAEHAVNQLAEHADRESWGNVIVFAAASAVDSPAFSNDLLKKLLPRESKAGAEARKRLKAKPASGSAEARAYARSVMAVRVAAAISTKPLPELRQRVERVRKQLFPPRSPSAAAGLASAGNAVLGYVKKAPKLTVAQRCMCVRTLRLIGTKEAHERLLEYRDEIDEAVIAELVESIDPLLIPRVVEMITETEESRKNAPGKRQLLRSTVLSYRIINRIQDLSALRGHAELRELNLASTNVGDDEIALLTRPEMGLGNLDAITLGGLTTDKALESLASPDSALKRLETLHAVSRGGMTSRVARAIAAEGSSLASLKTLWVYSPDPDACATILAERGCALKQLRCLGFVHGDLFGSDGLSDQGVAALASPTTGLSGLERLHIHSSRVTDATIEMLADPDTGLRNLVELDLTSAAISDQGLRTLVAQNSGLKRLKKLRLDTTDVTKQGYEWLCAERPDLEIDYQANLFALARSRRPTSTL